MAKRIRRTQEAHFIAVTLETGEYAYWFVFDKERHGHYNMNIKSKCNN